MTRRSIRVKSKLLLVLVLFSVAAISGCTGGNTDTQSTTTAPAPTTSVDSGAATTAPIANAGGDESLEAGTVMTYDATGSTDPDGGSIVSYEWKITGTPSGKEAAIGSVIYTGTEPKWTTSYPMKPADIGPWTMEVTVTNDKGASAVDTMMVTVIESSDPTIMEAFPEDDGS